MRVECDEKTKGILDKEEKYEIAEAEYTVNRIREMIPARYWGSDIVRVIKDGQMCGYKMIPTQCRVDPKEFPIYCDMADNPYSEQADIAEWLDETVRINEADINLESYITDNFDEMKDRIYISLRFYQNVREGIPYKEFEPFQILYEIEIVVDEIRFRVTIDNDRVEQWGITLEELDKIAMENSMRDLPAVLRTGEDSNTGEYNLLLGDKPDTLDKTYVLANTDVFHGVSVLAYPGVLEKVAEILDDDFVFYAKNAAYVILSASNKDYDGWLAKAHRRWNPHVYWEDYFSPFVHEYIRDTGEIVTYMSEFV